MIYLILGANESRLYFASIKRRLDILKINFWHRDKDLHQADESRSLYSLHQPVRKITAYPEDFSGDICENFSNFKEKFLNTLEANHVCEKNKVQALHKHLKDFAK